MKWVQVRTQAEADKAAKAGDGLEVVSGPDVEIMVRGSSTVRAYGSSTVRAYDSSTVTAYGSSTVTAYGSSTVRAYDSSTVRAYDSSTVTAYDSSTVTAYDSSTVTAYGSSTVRAYGSSTVRAYDSSTVRAYGYVAVTRQPGHKGKVTGGVVIKVTALTSVKVWCDYYGVEPDAGVVILYKAVGQDFRSPHGFDYTPGTIPVASDWDSGERECGGGLHFSPRPFMAFEFYDKPDKPRYVGCPVRITHIRKPKADDSYPQKVKAKGCCGPVFECDIDGRPL